MNINDLSVKTNSPCGEMMNNTSSHSEIKHKRKQVLSKKQNISSEQITVSSRSLSSELISNKSEQEAVGNEDGLPSSVKLESEDKTLSSAYGGLSSSSSLHSKKSILLGSNCYKTDVKPFPDIKYCTVGIQTDCNMAYHSVCGHHESCFIHSIFPTDIGKSYSVQETMPVYRRYSRAVEFRG
jgi:hypothetical protein